MKPSHTTLIIICVLIIITIVSSYIGYKVGYKSVFDSEELMIYACNDGCSIATKDNQGSLTNETFECWEECDNYIKEVLQE